MNEIVGDQNCQNLRRIIHAGLICHLEFGSHCVTTSHVLSNQSTLFFWFYWASIEVMAFPQACLHVVHMPSSFLFRFGTIVCFSLLTRTKLMMADMSERSPLQNQKGRVWARFTFSWILNSWNESRMPTLNIWNQYFRTWGIDFKLFPILLIWLW